MPNIVGRMEDGCQPDQAARIVRLIEAGAGVDAALALLAYELPAWHLCRLVWDEGRWFCALSRQPNLPPALQETAEGDADDETSAILEAVAEARRMEPRSTCAAVSSAPSHADGSSSLAVSCDDFR